MPCLPALPHSLSAGLYPKSFMADSLLNPLPISRSSKMEGL